MAGSTFGKLFCVTAWGESHGEAVGVVVDGVPAGLPLSDEDIQKYLDRRKPGQSRYTTARAEEDKVHILSGLFKGKTTGTPVSMIVRNRDQRSADYSNIADHYRPGHADYVYDMKYGFRDYRGGGRSSARETIARVAAGALACKILQTMGISVTAYVSSIGPVYCDPARFDQDHTAVSPLCMPDAMAEAKAAAVIEECQKAGTSVGGCVECVIRGMRPGVGEPVFGKLDACLAAALFSIGAVKAVEIGSGAACSSMYGHENNDTYTLDEAGILQKESNHAGGIYGGISDGSDILLRAHFKPTPSISRPQQALRRDGTVEELVIHGRHDPVIVPRAAVVTETMAAVTILDLLMQNMTATMEGLQRFYSSGTPI